MTIKDLYNNQKIRFLFVGGLNTLIGYTIFFLLTYFGVWYILSNTIGFVISIVNSYFWNKYFVFKKNDNSIKEIIKFLMVYAVQYLFGISFLYVCVEFFKIKPYIAGVMGIGLCAVISFIGHKYFTYKSK